MKVTELLVESNQQIDEIPAGMIGQGVKKLASKIPGSIGAKAQGAYDTGKVANQLYKEFYVYLGRVGREADEESLASFLKSKGIDDELINKHVGNPTPAATASPSAPTSPVAKTPAKKKPAVKSTTATPAQNITQQRAAFQQRAAAAQAKKAKPIREALDKSKINKIFMGVAQDLAAGGGPTSTASKTTATGSAPSVKSTTSSATAPSSSPASATTAPAAGGSMIGKAAQAIGKAAGTAVKGAKTGYQQGLQGTDQQPAQAGVKSQKLKGQVNVGTLSKLFPNIDQQALTKAVMTVKSGQAPSRAHISTLASLAAEMIKADPRTTVAAANVLKAIRADQPTA